MPIISWSDSFSVGNVALDNQHKELFSLVNQLYDAMASGQGRHILDQVLEKLVGYTVRHFADEETRMRQAEFPSFDAHKYQHDELTKQVLDFQTEFRAGKAALSVQLLSFLQDWLKRHIQESDRAYGPFLARA